jgi:hypothetical protein
MVKGMQCGFDSAVDHCTCNANTACRGAMTAFYTCMAMTGANSVGCATTFATNAYSTAEVPRWPATSLRA